MNYWEIKISPIPDQDRGTIMRYLINYLSNNKFDAEVSAELIPKKDGNKIVKSTQTEK